MDSGGEGNTSDSDNNAKLLRLLKDTPAEKRTARFRCVLAVTPITPDTGPSNSSASPVCFADELEMQTELFDGTCEGSIDLAPRGAGGFGYDPLFIPDGFQQSFAELGEEVKNGSEPPLQGAGETQIKIFAAKGLTAISAPEIYFGSGRCCRSCRYF